MTLNAVRREQILDILNESYEVRVVRLARQLQVSEMTIRRDLKVLEEEGVLRRVHGGAVTAAPVTVPSMSTRTPLRDAEKAAIGRLAATLVEPKTQVFIGGSSTTFHLSRALARGPQAAYATNSIIAAQELASGHQRDIRVFGGMLRAEVGTLLGGEVIQSVEQRIFDFAFIGILAIDPKFGFLDPTEWHVHLKRTVRRRARQVVVVADHSKFSARGEFCSFKFEEVDILVTDCAPSPENAALLEESGVRILY